jgi:hypothetical protein
MEGSFVGHKAGSSMFEIYDLGIRITGCKTVSAKGCDLGGRFKDEYHLLGYNAV